MKIGTIINSLKKDRVRLTRKEGWIPHEIYDEMKKIKHCQKCKKETKLQIHHKIPVSKGGKSEKNNLIALCKKCHELEDEKVGVR